ncbi:histidine phosphatase family protein [Actinoplanes sp. LDG1-06]|uniref:Histidine phosphatase family protein n=1 Tax=Paractinoplanes ovalisporus TaxID=2810368 RepID=A0ABS2A8I3_9ACTN|nr:histidine phosphatase family protein [Actinoplanes ovalisporus]MBM2616151.1 histidine phosphatase family protein [Actinoplanes ovalisporus]
MIQRGHGSAATGPVPNRILLVRHAMPHLDPAVAPDRWHLGPEGLAAARALLLPPDAYLVASSEPKAAETLAAAFLTHPDASEPLPAGRTPTTGTPFSTHATDTPHSSLAGPHSGEPFPAPTERSPAAGALLSEHTPGTGRPPATSTPHASTAPNTDRPLTAEARDVVSAALREEGAPTAGTGSAPAVWAGDVARLVVVDAGFDEVRRPHEWRDDHRERARAYVEGTAHPGWEPHADVVARFGDAVARHTARAAGRPLVIGTHGMAMSCWLAATAHVTGPAGDFWAGLRFPDIVEVRV